MNIIELIRNVKNDIYLIIDGLFKDLESTRVKLVYLSMAMFAYSIIYGLSNPSSTATTAITATASVFSIAIGAYVGSNSMSYWKQGASDVATTPDSPLPKDKIDPDSASA